MKICSLFSFVWCRMFTSAWWLTVSESRYAVLVVAWCDTLSSAISTQQLHFSRKTSYKPKGLTSGFWSGLQDLTEEFGAKLYERLEQKWCDAQVRVDRGEFCRMWRLVFVWFSCLWVFVGKSQYSLLMLSLLIFSSKHKLHSWQINWHWLHNQ